jgi:hypothetical protein
MLLWKIQIAFLNLLDHQFPDLMKIIGVRPYIMGFGEMIFRFLILRIKQILIVLEVVINIFYPVRNSLIIAQEFRIGHLLDLLLLIDPVIV